MAAVSIPSYSVQFSVAADPKSIQDVFTTSEILSPKANIPQGILKMAEELGRSYAYTLKNEFSDAIKMRLFLSKEGVKIESSDEKAKTFFLERMQGTPEKEIVLDFDFSKRKTAVQKLVTNTCTLRFVHLLSKLRTFDKENPKICLVGPGLVKPKGGFPFCPQFVELYLLFPNGQFLLLDNDLEVLKCLKGKFSVYAPLMIKKHLAQKDLKKEHRTLLLRMQKKLTELNINKKEGDAKLLIKLDPEKIEVREFDILTSEFGEKEEQTFDIMIATFSITIALEDNKDVQQHLLVLAKFLKMLKEEGTLYIDSYVADFYENPEQNARKLYLEGLVGNKLEIKKIKISDFFPESHGDVFTFKHFVEPTITNTMTTTSIIAITRKAEKVSQEEISTIELMYGINSLLDQINSLA